MQQADSVSCRSSRASTVLLLQETRDECQSCISLIRLTRYLSSQKSDGFVVGSRKTITWLTELSLLATIEGVAQAGMPATYEGMVKIMEAALGIFFQKESSVVLSGVSERSSCARLALYLQKAADEAGYGKYYADTEYNRMQAGKIKTIISGNEVKLRITCDLLLHGRGECGIQENLIAVEMKKDGRPSSHYMKDRNRLIALTRDPSPSANIVWNVSGPSTWPEHVCGYILGVFVMLDRSSRTCLIEYYKKGVRACCESRNF